MKKIKYFLFGLVLFLGFLAIYKFNLSYLKHRGNPTVYTAQNKKLTIKNDPNIKIDRISLVATDSGFEPSSFTVGRGHLVIITLTSNQGYHDFRVSQLGISSPPLATHKTETFQFVSTMSGIFKFFSDTNKYYGSPIEGVMTIE